MSLGARVTDSSTSVTTTLVSAMRGDEDATTVKGTKDNVVVALFVFSST